MWKMGDISLLGCRVGGLGVRSLPKSRNVMQSFETPRLLLNEALRSLNPPYLVNIGKFSTRGSTFCTFVGLSDLDCGRMKSVDMVIPWSCFSVFVLLHSL